MNFNDLYAKRNSALDECGIGHDIENKLNAAEAEVQKFCALVNQRIHEQLYYNFITNIPYKQMKREEATSHAIKSGIVSAISQYLEWDINNALQLAADIAEDVNAHEEAAQIRKM